MQPYSMNWQRLLSSSRFGEAQGRLPVDLGRTPFHKDYDRIIFSTAFRRLNRKTQVHPLNENDHIHNRMTHSLEVGCVGRSLGSMVGVALGGQLPLHIEPSDIGAIVQAACLAHDIGNPPYGHGGEDAIRQWFKDPRQARYLEPLTEFEQLDLMTFEGNAQGFRLVTQVEYNRFEGGMRPTFATLGAFLKYPWSNREVAEGRARKFGCYQSELPILKETAHVLGLPQVSEERWCRHPLVYLVEAADDICYCLIDLEDGVELGLLRYHEVEDLLKPLLEDRWEQVEAELINDDAPRRKLQILRGYAMETMVQAVTASFMKHEAELLNGQLEGDIIRYTPDEVQMAIRSAKALARERIFKDARKLSIEIGTYATLDTLLRTLIDAAYEVVTTGSASFRNERVLEMMGQSAPKPDWTLYRAYMRVMDYVAGMTDTYAATLAKQFSGYHPL